MPPRAFSTRAHTSYALVVGAFFTSKRNPLRSWSTYAFSIVGSFFCFVVAMTAASADGGASSASARSAERRCFMGGAGDQWGCSQSISGNVFM